MTEPTEAMEKVLTKAIGYRNTYAEHALRAILEAPQDYGLIKPPTRRDLMKLTHIAGPSSGTLYVSLEEMIVAGYATEDSIPEPAPVPTYDKMNALVDRAMVEYHRTPGISGNRDALMDAIDRLIQLAERGDGPKCIPRDRGMVSRYE